MRTFASATPILLTALLLAAPSRAQPLTPAPVPPPLPNTAMPSTAMPGTPPDATPKPPEPKSIAGLEAALHDYPPLIIGAGTTVTSKPGGAVPKSCPDSGASVEQKGGPTMEYLGSMPGDPDLCRMKVGGEEMQAWYGIWVTTWPGADSGHRALKHVMEAKTGDVAGFDTIAAPGAQWHDLIRQEGVEKIYLLGKTYTALKLSHYREGYGGNDYRSVSTVWKDMATGLLIFGTYQHISGAPELDDPLIPTKITPAP